MGAAHTVAAAAAYAVPAAGAARLSEQAARRALLAAGVLHGAALGWSLLGASGPRFGFAPAVSVTAWLVLTVYAVERQIFPQLHARWALAGLGAAAVLLALFFPGTPLVSASPWLPLHLALGIASYGLFGAAVIHAWLLQRVEHQMRAASEQHVGLPLLTLERLTFRFATAGFVLLSATLLAGLFFSEMLYGRSWRWDHKTIFSVLAWVAFAMLLLGRARFGWRGRRAVRVIYIGALLLLLAYVGSRFVLEVVLARTA